MITSHVATKLSDELICEAGTLLADHKCNDVVAFDVSEKSGWTDYIMVATVSSLGHLRGVLKHLYAFLDEKGLEPRVRQKKIQHEGWIFVDCGDAVFHIMNNQAREFYQLENLWYDSRKVYSS